MINYYQVLGLKQNCTNDQIKKAYREYSIKIHPDKHCNDEFFKDRFLEIKKAYDILIDSNKRYLHDSELNKNYNNSYSNNWNTDKLELENKVKSLERELKNKTIEINSIEKKFNNNKFELENKIKFLEKELENKIIEINFIQKKFNDNNVELEKYKEKYKFFRFFKKAEKEKILFKCSNSKLTEKNLFFKDKKYYLKNIDSVKVKRIKIPNKIAGYLMIIVCFIIFNSMFVFISKSDENILTALISIFIIAFICFSIIGILNLFESRTNVYIIYQNNEYLIFEGNHKKALELSYEINNLINK